MRSVITRQPGNEFEVRANGSYAGPDDSWMVSGSVSGPIVTDKLNFKFGAYFNNDGGYFKNLFDGSNHGKASTEIVRGALEFRPAETIRMVGKLEYFHSKGDGPSGQNHGIYKRDTFAFSIDNPGFYENETLLANHKTEIDIGDGKLTNIFGWRNYDASTGGDIDATARFLFHSNTRFKQEQFSDELRFNQRFGAPGYQPVHLLAEHHEPDQIDVLYRAADVCVVTSLHDGMNLVCKEFVAARDDERGVLILSRFAGAARDLQEALIVNPYHVEETADALHRAATMAPAEQRERMASLRSTVQEFNVFRWAGRMLADAGRWRLRVAVTASGRTWRMVGDVL